MAEWHDYLSGKTGDGHTVVGNLKVLDSVFSPQLGNYRDILVYLPPSYSSGRDRYPVLYLHDGQNLFDAATSFAGEWRVDESMEALSEEGFQAIVVGIPNAGKTRLDEYSPFAESNYSSGNGRRYLAFIAGTLKPRVDADFRTRPDRQHTGIMGSSMGGLISLYAFFYCSEVFGFAGVMSPSLWFAKGAIYSYVRKAPFVSGKIYLDAGTREHGEGVTPLARAFSRRYYASVRRMQRLLANKGYRPQRELLYVEEKSGRHEEEAWARRFPGAIRFFLGQLQGLQG